MIDTLVTINFYTNVNIHFLPFFVRIFNISISFNYLYVFCLSFSLTKFFVQIKLYFTIVLTQSDSQLDQHFLFSIRRFWLLFNRCINLVFGLTISIFNLYFSEIYNKHFAATHQKIQAQPTSENYLSILFIFSFTFHILGK